MLETKSKVEIMKSRLHGENCPKTLMSIAQNPKNYGLTKSFQQEGNPSDLHDSHHVSKNHDMKAIFQQNKNLKNS